MKKLVRILPLCVLVACSVTVDEAALYGCESDSDCGGDGYLCIERVDLGARVCCIPADEVCDGGDNDCDGEVDEELPSEDCYEGPEGTAGVGQCRAGALRCIDAERVCTGAATPGEETCNGLDDDCDGAVDEDFDLQTDARHCGGCNMACAAGKTCVEGACPLAAEASCFDEADEDQDGLTDCADSDCEGVSCGEGCLCSGGVRTETVCTGTLDEDTDGSADCADTDCDGASCGEHGRTCGGGVCACFGAASPADETDCSDGLDNDCDGLTDCADPTCNALACGAGCVCAGTVQKETDCGDLQPNGMGIDNDGDGQANCADIQDCPLGSTCQFKQGANIKPGTCRANKSCA